MPVTRRARIRILQCIVTVVGEATDVVICFRDFFLRLRFLLDDHLFRRSIAAGRSRRFGGVGIGRVTGGLLFPAMSLVVFHMVYLSERFPAVETVEWLFVRMHTVVQFQVTRGRKMFPANSTLEEGETVVVDAAHANAAAV